MNSNELRYYLTKYPYTGRLFLAVFFAWMNLYKLDFRKNDKGRIIVVNEQCSTLPGSHWISVYDGLSKVYYKMHDKLVNLFPTTRNLLEINNNFSIAIQKFLELRAICSLFFALFEQRL